MAVVAALNDARPSGARPVIDVPEMRECFAAFRIDAVDTRYTVAGGKGQEVSEIIVCGPRPDDPDWSVVGHRRDERGRLGMTTGWIS
jgi:hypothetical protein